MAGAGKWLAGARADILAVHRAAFLAGPLDRPDLGAEEAVPELKAAVEAGPAFVESRFSRFVLERLPDRGDFVGGMEVEVGEPPPQGRVGRAPIRVRGSPVPESTCSRMRPAVSSTLARRVNRTAKVWWVSGGLLTDDGVGFLRTRLDATDSMASRFLAENRRRAVTNWLTGAVGGDRRDSAYHEIGLCLAHAARVSRAAVA